MNITIIGAGNIGTQFAIEFADKGHEVIMYTSKVRAMNSELCMLDENNIITKKGTLKKITDKLEDALKEAEYVIITYPAFMLEEISKQIFEYIKPGLKIGVIPGTGGAEFFFAEHIKKGVYFFGLQRVPSVARLVEDGKSVRVSGKRDKLHLAAIPSSAAGEIAELFQNVFEMKCVVLPNYLSVTLTPSNPILHTTRLKTLFNDYAPGKVYSKNPLFYQEWTDESSKLLLQCDAELQELCRVLEGIDLSEVRSLKKHYESETVEELTKKLQSIKSLQGLLSPMKEVEKGFVPDFESRYFTADFPYGLSIIYQLATIMGVSVPFIKETLEWYYLVTNSTEKLNLADFGLSSQEDVYKFYNV